MERDHVDIEPTSLLRLLRSAYSSYAHGYFTEKIGVLVGRDDNVSDILEATKESTPVFCSLDHEKVFEARGALKEGELIVGWYHTHDGFLTPSGRDERTQSYWQAFPGTFSVIVDVRHAKVEVWRLGSHGVEKVPFTVRPTTSEVLDLGKVFEKQTPHVSSKLMQEKEAAVIGGGQLGTLAAAGLCKAGIGVLRLLDRDRVELRNVNSQLLYSLEDIGRFKVDVLAEQLRNLAPWTKIEHKTLDVPVGTEEDELYDERTDEAREFMDGSDIALSCLDSVRSRITVSFLCRELEIPLIDAGCHGLNGQVLATIWGETPCIGCLDLKGTGDASCAVAPTTVSTGFAVSSVQTHIASDLLHERPVPTCVAIDLSRFMIHPVQLLRKQDCWICG